MSKIKILIRKLTEKVLCSLNMSFPCRTYRTSETTLFLKDLLQKEAIKGNCVHLKM
jgi:hypothetical protein